jgi:hypothetical protein
MPLEQHFSMQGTLTVQYTDASAMSIADVEERAVAILDAHGIADYRITGISMDHDAYVTGKQEAHVEFNMIGDFKE